MLRLLLAFRPALSTALYRLYCVTVSFRQWRVVHRIATAVLGILAALHSSLTIVLYRDWSPDSVWFLGTGLGLLLLAAVNWTHVGIEPCELPTAPVVRFANFTFAVFGVGAVLAVPEPQAYLMLAALVAQALAGTATLKRSA